MTKQHKRDVRLCNLITNVSHELQPLSRVAYYNNLRWDLCLAKAPTFILASSSIFNTIYLPQQP